MSRAAVAFALGVLAGCGAPEKPAAPAPAEPVTWSVASAASATEVQVGEAFDLTLTVRHPPGGDFVAPPEADFEPFAVLDVTEETVSPVESRLVYRLGAFHLPAELEVAPLTVRFRDEAGETGTLATAPVSIRIVTSLTQEVEDIHDIKEPVALLVPRDTRWLWLLLAGLAAFLLKRLARRYFGKSPETIAAPEPPPPPAYEEALAALDRLAEKKLVERGELEAFHAELAELAKRYAGRRFEVHYLERTTGEILRDLRGTSLEEGPRAELRAVLDACDLVKFARVVPGAEEARRTFEAARRFVERTRPIPPAPEAAPLEKTA